MSRMPELYVTSLWAAKLPIAPISNIRLIGGSAAVVLPRCDRHFLNCSVRESNGMTRR